MAKYAKISVLNHSNIRFLLPEYDVEGNFDLEKCMQKMAEALEKNIRCVLPDKPDLIVLPETCDRYINLTSEQKKEYYRYRGDRFLDFYRKIAKENNCYIAYPTVRFVSDDKKTPFRNSTYIIGRDGEIVGIYDKNFLVLREREEVGTAFGTEAPVFDLDFGRVCCLICFDLNYIELMHRYAEQKPDLLIFSSAFHGSFVQKQWAYNCRSYFVGAVIADNSRIISPVGETVSTTCNYQGYTTCKVNMDYAMMHLDFNNTKIKKAKEKYGELLQVHNPGHLGSVMLTYEGTDKTIMDIVKEFDLELLDDYFNRCREIRKKYIMEDKDK